MKIVYTYVCGDIIHRGHLQYLKNAKALGNKLVVGVLTDEAIMERKPRPTISFQERFDLIDGLKFVDLTVAQATYSPKHNIDIIKPDVLVESDSHKKPCSNPFGRTVVLPYFPGQSSSKIKEKIRGKS